MVPRIATWCPANEATDQIDRKCSFPLKMHNAGTTDTQSTAPNNLHKRRQVHNLPNYEVFLCPDWFIRLLFLPILVTYSYSIDFLGFDGRSHWYGFGGLCGCLQGASLFVVLNVEVHEEDKENRRVQQQEGRDELGEFAILGQHCANGVHDAENELGLNCKDAEGEKKQVMVNQCQVKEARYTGKLHGRWCCIMVAVKLHKLAMRVCWVGL